MNGERGFALVLVLVVTALMVATATELIHQVYVDTTLSRGFRDGQQASLLAESGVTGGVKLLRLAQSLQDYTSLADAWATPFKMDDETGRIEITAAEENGRINLSGLVQPNGMPDEFTLKALKRLGKQLQLPEDIWNALADWLDSDDQTSPGGAESSYYMSLKQPYSARNGKPATLAELSLVKGFTPGIIAAMRPFVTIHGQAGDQINVNTAPAQVLMALDDRIDNRMAERIMEERQLKPFRSASELSRVPGFDTIAIGLLGRVGVKGSLYRITSVARVKDAARTVEAVVRPSGGGQEIVSWQEY